MNQEIASFANFLDDGLMIVAQDGNVIFANKLAHDYFGQNLVGQPAFAIIVWAFLW